MCHARSRQDHAAILSTRSFSCQPSVALDPQLVCYSWVTGIADVAQVVVLRRDGWRCQACGSRRDPSAPYKQLRSQQGNDEDSNLITLCASCHEKLHCSV